jgi:hypothetical protein
MLAKEEVALYPTDTLDIYEQAMFLSGLERFS